MTNSDKLFTEIANGNADALEFIQLWSSLAHKLDDIIDESDVKPDSENIISLSHLILRFTTCKFYDLCNE